MKVLLVCSSGGHLDQLLLLDDWLEEHDVAIATFLKPDALDRISRWRRYALHWPTNRNAVNLARNLWAAIRIIRAEKPDIIVSSGAGGAVPFFYLAKVMPRVLTVYVECYDRVSSPTLTARLLRPVADMFLVQWETQLVGWPRRVYTGPSR
jgi:UDP-N-acetylglucosamine:LPS N-acetylglucosamine transferase